MPSPDVVRPVNIPMLYNEPESHLDEMVASICKLPGIDKNSRFLGLTYKEESTLRRIRDRGYLNISSCNFQKDFGINATAAGLETVQQVISSGSCEKGLASRRPVDVLILRHIVEHAHDPMLFLTEVKNSLRPRYTVIEVPDCRRAISSFDYTTIWEEHISYFTPSTLLNLCVKAGFNPINCKVFPLPYEDSIVILLEEGGGKEEGLHLNDEILKCKNFGEQFPKHRKEILTFLERECAGGCCILGAGHLAIAFVHLHGIQHLLGGIFDDSTEKLNRIFPGTTLRIRPSSELSAGEFNRCLLCVNPASEQKVIDKFAQFRDNGGRFLSIFPISPNYLLSPHGTE